MRRSADQTTRGETPDRDHARRSAQTTDNRQRGEAADSREEQQKAVTPTGTWILLVITAVVLYLCWTMVAPFVSVLTWSIALAIVTNPLSRRLRRRLPNTVVALLVVTLVVVVVAILAIFVSQGLVHEITRGQQALRGVLQPAALQRVVEQQPRIAGIWRWTAQRIDLAEIAQQASAAIASRVAAGVGASAVLFSEAAMSLFVLFFFVRDEEMLAGALRRTVPLTKREFDAVWERVSSAIRASAYGRVLIGAIQGLLGGVIFWAVGLPAPLFWAIIMGALSILPVVGAFVVWVPAAAVLLVTGHWIRALIVVGCGIAIIHPVDNILYPVLVGPRMGLHPIVLLIAFLGGIIVFGAAGLILGPAIVALALALGDIWRQRADA
jgi:predicted PurR-regulated permease PerM